MSESIQKELKVDKVKVLCGSCQVETNHGIMAQL